MKRVKHFRTFTDPPYAPNLDYRCPLCGRDDRINVEPGDFESVCQSCGYKTVYRVKVTENLKTFRQTATGGPVCHYCDQLTLQDEDCEHCGKRHMWDEPLVDRIRAGLDPFFIMPVDRSCEVLLENSGYVWDESRTYLTPPKTRLNLVDDNNQP